MKIKIRAVKLPSRCEQADTMLVLVSILRGARKGSRRSRELKVDGSIPAASTYWPRVQI
jgi:hypothetical protein